jgi:hypothetical protein
MALVEDHDVIKTFTTNRTDHAFDIRILPWLARGGDNLGDSHRIDLFPEVVTCEASRPRSR